MNTIIVLRLYNRIFGYEHLCENVIRYSFIIIYTTLHDITRNKSDDRINEIY